MAGGDWSVRRGGIYRERDCYYYQSMYCYGVETENGCYLVQWKRQGCRTRLASACRNPEFKSRDRRERKRKDYHQPRTRYVSSMAILENVQNYIQDTYMYSCCNSRGVVARTRYIHIHCSRLILSYSIDFRENGTVEIFHGHEAF